MLLVDPGSNNTTAKATPSARKPSAGLGVPRLVSGLGKGSEVRQMEDLLTTGDHISSKLRPALPGRLEKLPAP